MKIGANKINASNIDFINEFGLLNEGNILLYTLDEENETILVDFEINKKDLLDSDFLIKIEGIQFFRNTFKWKFSVCNSYDNDSNDDNIAVT